MSAVDRRNIVVALVVVLLIAAIAYSCGRDIGPAEGAAALLLL